MSNKAQALIGASIVGLIGVAAITLGFPFAGGVIIAIALAVGVVIAIPKRPKNEIVLP